jgi:hypothetical protein
MNAQKKASLAEKAKAFEYLLVQHRTDRDVQLWLTVLGPLFDSIKAGKIDPPHYFEHGLALGKEHPFYGPDSIYNRVYSDFLCALEDWESMSWYQEAMARSKQNLS